MTTQKKPFIQSRRGITTKSLFLTFMALALPLVLFIVALGSTISVRSKAAANKTLKLTAKMLLTVTKNSRGCDSGTTRYYVKFTWKKLNGTPFTITYADYPMSSVGTQQTATSTIQAPEKSYRVSYEIFQVTRGRGTLPQLNNSNLESSVIPYNPSTMTGETRLTARVACK